MEKKEGGSERGRRKGDLEKEKIGKGKTGKGCGNWVEKKEEGVGVREGGSIETGKKRK